LHFNKTIIKKAVKFKRWNNNTNKYNKTSRQYNCEIFIRDYYSFLVVCQISFLVCLVKLSWERTRAYIISWSWIRRLFRYTILNLTFLRLGRKLKKNYQNKNVSNNFILYRKLFRDSFLWYFVFLFIDYREKPINFIQTCTCLKNEAEQSFLPWNTKTRTSSAKIFTFNFLLKCHNWIAYCELFSSAVKAVYYLYYNAGSYFYKKKLLIWSSNV
jgi:hypothetical protein